MYPFDVSVGGTAVLTAGTLGRLGRLLVSYRAGNPDKFPFRLRQTIPLTGTKALGYIILVSSGVRLDCQIDFEVLHAGVLLVVLALALDPSLLMRGIWSAAYFKVMLESSVQH